MVFFEDVLHAEKRIRPFVPKTPLVRCYALELALKSTVRFFLKCEHLHETNSFKVRGAFNALLALSEEEKKRGVIARSSGNFAQALAYAGSVLQIPITIVMGSNVMSIKRKNTEQWGARVLIADPHHDKQLAIVTQIAQDEELSVLSPFDHLHVIEGAATIALEIWEDLPSLTHYVCQIGGGGLMAGTSAAFKTLNPQIETIGIEPAQANDFFLSHQAGHRVRLDTIDTIADGLRAPQVGQLNWPLLQKCVDRATTVSEKEIKGALRFLYEKVGMLIEPSGAVSFAAFLYHPEWFPPQTDVVCILSGANIDKEVFYYAIQ